MPELMGRMGMSWHWQYSTYTALKTRDVKTGYFSEPVCRKRFFTSYRLPKGLL